MRRINIPKVIYREMVEHVQLNLPEEACGILAGRDALVEKILLVTNQAHSPVRFYMEPLALFRALEWIDSAEMDIIAIFHSHPQGPQEPSETDIKEFLYEGSATIILSPGQEGWNVRGFDIRDGRYEEIELIITRNP